MKSEDRNQQKLWPIFESCEQVGPVGLAILNVGGVLAVLTPFLMALGGLCIGLWLANLAISALIEMFSVSAQAAAMIGYAIKIPQLVLGALVLRNLIPHIPALVEGARQAVQDDEH